MTTDGASSRITLLICTAAALLEGFDNQSMGVAAPKLVPEFALSAAQASIVFSSTTVGLFLGAALGGRIADKVGRRRTLMTSMLVFGLGSLITSVTSGPTTLFVVRLLTGLGLGGAMPNFIALASEAVHASRRLSSVTVVMAGMPFGGLLAGLVALGEALGWGWRMIFYLGGVAPLLLALVMWRWLPESGSERREGSASPKPPLERVGSVLFGRQRALTTLELWGGFFFTQLILLLLLNWLPSLFIGLGFSRAQASLASMCFNACGAASSLVLGRLHAGSHRRFWMGLTYGGMAVALVALPMTRQSFGWAALVCGCAGIFIIGAQLVLFALAPLYYERAVRGTGVGASVAVGRFGSVIGPLYAGALLARGGGSSTVLLGIVPFVIIGGLSALALTWRPQRGE